MHADSWVVADATLSQAGQKGKGASTPASFPVPQDTQNDVRSMRVRFGRKALVSTDCFV